MKTEQFYSLILQEIFGVSKTEADKHFKDFKRARRRFPKIAEALLEKDVVDQDGNILEDVDIFLLIDELKESSDSSSLIKDMVSYDIRFLDLYLQEIDTQLRFARRCYEDYLMAKEDGDIEDIFLHIHHFVIHTTNVDKLLDKMLNSSQGIVSYLLKQAVDLTDIDFKSFKRLRNHLEHFEERLDAWFYLYVDGPILDMNLANSGTRGLPEERCLRLLKTDENVFVILGEQFDLNDLHHQVYLLSQRLSVLLEDSAPTNA